MTAMSQPANDAWSNWLLHARHGDDPEYGAVVDRTVLGYADRVLDGARLHPGMVLADVGAGDGLLAFRAIERLGPDLRIVLTDISAPLLHHAELRARRLGVQDHMSFLLCSAERMAAIEDGTVDAVVTRASVAYVPDKRAAFAEMHRILKSGGMLSMGEPILQDEAFATRALRTRVDALGADADRFLPLMLKWKSAQFPDTEGACAANPLVNFAERDLLTLAGAAGFADLHLRLHIDVVPSLIRSWQVFLDSSPHPWAPSLAAIMAERFSPDERRFFESVVRPTVESGRNVTIDRVAYVTAQKPTPIVAPGPAAARG
jgi:SAM-dependent methyltransferase